MDISIAERVENGAKVLDDYCGDWFFAVDTDILDITGLETCILGQLFGSFQNGTRDLGFEGDRSEEERLGFEMTHGEYCSGHTSSVQAQIEDEWRRVIAERSKLNR